MRDLASQATHVAFAFVRTEWMFNLSNSEQSAIMSSLFFDHTLSWLADGKQRESVLHIWPTRTP